MWSKAFWMATANLVVATFCSVLGAQLGGSALGFDLLTADWPTMLSLAGGAAFAMLLASVAQAASSTGGKGNPMLVLPPLPKPPRQLIRPRMTSPPEI